MDTLANSVFAPADVRAIDQRAIESHGILGFTLMERAATATVAAAMARWPSARRWLVVCGGGNNGGDGYVIARLAVAAGCEVFVRALVPVSDLHGDAARAAAEFIKAGGHVEPISCALPPADLVIDALLGTGLGRPVTGEWRKAITAINEQSAPVVAVDIPSGLDAETGAVIGAAIRAALTVTFVGRKTGLFLGEGPDYTGAVEFADLGIPVAAYADFVARFRLFDEQTLAKILPPRRATAHKGNFGHVLVIGGNHGMAGAVRLAGEAALRAGAGLVTVATRMENAPLLTVSRPELMTVAVESVADLETAWARATVVAIGPGLGTDDWAQSLFQRVFSTPGRPIVADADALNLLASVLTAKNTWILTPHPGEAARLLGWTSTAVQADRLGALSALVERYGGVVTLKGRGTLVGAAGQCPWLIEAGNPGMASGGMGDVLTGLTAGILAQAPGDLHTAAAAAFVHAKAGDAAAGASPRGLLASDLIAAIRSNLNPAC